MNQKILNSWLENGILSMINVNYHPGNEIIYVSEVLKCNLYD